MSIEELFPGDDVTPGNNNTQEDDISLGGDILPMLPLEGAEEEFVDIQLMAPLEEVKEGKWLKFVTSESY